MLFKREVSKCGVVFLVWSSSVFQKLEFQVIIWSKSQISWASFDTLPDYIGIFFSFFFYKLSDLQSVWSPPRSSIMFDSWTSFSYVTALQPNSVGVWTGEWHSSSFQPKIQKAC